MACILPEVLHQLHSFSNDTKIGVSALQGANSQADLRDARAEINSMFQNPAKQINPCTLADQRTINQSIESKKQMHHHSHRL